MKCKLARTNIALWVGHDLDSDSVKDLEQHCIKCEQCSDHWQKMKSNIDVLQQMGSIEHAPCFASVWPSLSTELPYTEPASRKSRIKDLATVVVILAACVLVAVLSHVPAPGNGTYYVGPEFDVQSLPASYEIYYADSSWKRATLPPSPAPMQNGSPVLNVDF